MAEARRINVSEKADDINERNPETLKDRGKSVVSQLRSQGQLVVLGWVGIGLVLSDSIDFVIIVIVKLLSR